MLIWPASNRIDKPEMDEPSPLEKRVTAMSILFAEVRHPDEFMNRELRAISRHSSKSPRTTWYRAYCNNEEVAFISVGRSEKRLIPYQLFVPRNLRGRGIGSDVLRSVEHLAQTEGYESVRVWPRPLDDCFDRRGLERWYSERGYTIVSDGTGDMEKRLTRLSAEQTERRDSEAPYFAACLQSPGSSLSDSARFQKRADFERSADGHS